MCLAVVPRVRWIEDSRLHVREADAGRIIPYA